MTVRDYLLEAIKLSEEAIENGGGPFGAIIVKNNRIIAYGQNSVTNDNDPTAHAEVNVIRNACRNLNTFDLSGCTIYSSCEPCPMCLSAIYWARIDKIYYSNTQSNAADIGFDDSFIYEEIPKLPENRTIPCERVILPQALSVFQKWVNWDNKTRY